MVHPNKHDLFQICQRLQCTLSIILARSARVLSLVLITKFVLNFERDYSVQDQIAYTY